MKGLPSSDHDLQRPAASQLLTPEGGFRDWEPHYQQACRDYATCDLTATPSCQQTDPTVQLIVKVYNEMTLAGSKLDVA